MKTKLFYFTGTGNSLTAAKELAKKLDRAEVISIPKALEDTESLAAEKIGIIFPVYIWGIPLIVIDFIKKLEGLDTNYIFAITTCGGFPAGTLLQTQKLLKAQGQELASGFSIMMPGNYTPMYGAKPEEVQQKMFTEMKEKINTIATVVNNNKVQKPEKNSLLTNFLFSSLIYKLSAAQMPKMDKDFWVDDNCDGCNICANICPKNNIVLENKKPTWHQKCEQCLACLQWCPKEAIQFGKKTVGRKRYRHPEIKISELIKA
jgi:ferredoxin